MRAADAELHELAHFTEPAPAAAIDWRRGESP